MDCCDREIISWSCCVGGGITSQMTQDLMLRCVEKRLPTNINAKFQIQWHSDNGPAYTANASRAFARQLGLIPCNSPAYCPESNGMAEAFVKTFKRDYVYLNRTNCAEDILNQIANWFEDYNENAPHKGLKGKSPREFLRLCQDAS
jgi:putative transposase